MQRLDRHTHTHTRTILTEVQQERYSQRCCTEGEHIPHLSLDFEVLHQQRGKCTTHLGKGMCAQNVGMGCVLCGCRRCYHAGHRTEWAV